MDNLEKFVNDLLTDKLEPYLKSEPVPEDNSGGVKVINVIDVIYRSFYRIKYGRNSVK